MFPLDITTRPLFNHYAALYPPRISELTFTNLYVWRQTRPIYWLEVQKSLIVCTRSAQGLVLLGHPLGEVPLTEVQLAIKEPIIGLDRIDQEWARAKLGNELDIVDDRDNADYVYKTGDLAELRGRRYSKKRNHVKRCLEQYDCTYEPITPKNIEECLTMQDVWCEKRACSDNPELCGEYQAIVETFAHFEEFGLLGGAIRLDGQIEAFSIGERLNPDTAVCHFEKAMPERTGLAQLITHWFCKYSLSDFAYVNREQDLGITGIRQAKQSYYPDHMVKKVKVQLQEGELKPNGETPDCSQNPTY
jgi:hypothetical protein